MKYTLTVLFLAVFISVTAFAAPMPGVNIRGTVDWNTMLINAEVSLDLISAGIRLPSGRGHGEMLLNSEYLRLILPGILNLQVDSSSTIGTLVDRGDLSITEAKNIALRAQAVPPALSPDMRNISSSYTIPLSGISTALLRHNSPSPVMRTMNPVSTAQYTGIVIIAAESLPVYGMRSSTLPVPCLFPKIWDSDMNLIYEKNMLESHNAPMIRYAPLQSIFQRSPSGLTPELTAVVGSHPLRIFASGVFGMKPTDLIIDRRDAQLIISSDVNRRLLTEGRVAIILADSVLKQEFK